MSMGFVVHLEPTRVKTRAVNAKRTKGIVNKKPKLFEVRG